MMNPCIAYEKVKEGIKDSSFFCGMGIEEEIRTFKVTRFPDRLPGTVIKQPWGGSTDPDSLKKDAVGISNPIIAEENNMNKIFDPANGSGKMFNADRLKNSEKSSQMLFFSKHLDGKVSQVEDEIFRGFMQVIGSVKMTQCNINVSLVGRLDAAWAEYDNYLYDKINGFPTFQASEPNANFEEVERKISTIKRRPVRRIQEHSFWNGIISFSEMFDKFLMIEPVPGTILNNVFSIYEDFITDVYSHPL